MDRSERPRSRKRRNRDAPAAEAPRFAAVGGRLAPLDAGQCEQIDRAVREILSTIGLSDASDLVAGTIEAVGGARGEAGRLLFPNALIDRALQDLRAPISLCGQRPEHDMHLVPGAVHVGTGGAAPTVLDMTTQRFRPSTLSDLYDAARLCDALEHVQFFSRSLVARDMETERALDLNTAFASLCGTAKHVMVSASQPEHVAPIARMCHAIAGSQDAFRARPFLSMNINHVVPPLRLHAEACAVMAECVRHGIPVHCNIFGQLGASSPVTTAGSVAQTMAEALAGMIFAWAIAPDARVICGPRPMITDLRTGGMSGGSGEQSLATAMAMQMCRWYGLASSAIAGATDSKVPDAQAGAEKALNVATAVHAGCNLVTQAAGMQAGLMGVSFEACVIDNDMLGTILRSAGPVEVSPETLAIADIRAVVGGEGHFLGQPDTYARMKSDFLYPQIYDRRSVEEWHTKGASDLIGSARARVDAILAAPHPDHVDAQLQRRLIAEFALAPNAPGRRDQGG